MEIHIYRNGVQEGPYQVADVQQMLGAGRLRPSDLGWHSGMVEWRAVGEIPEIQQKPKAEDDTSLKIELPRSPLIRLGPSGTATPPSFQPATAKQKAFLSYMGVTFPGDLQEGEAERLSREVSAKPSNSTRVQKWAEESIRLHPEIFAEEAKTRRGSRTERFHKLVATEGAECFREVSLAHVQVLLQYLDVRHPNWDVREKEAAWNYLFPAIAEKFPQTVTKAWRGKLQFKEGPKVAEEIQHASRELATSRRVKSPLLLAAGITLVAGGVIGSGFYFFKGRSDNRPQEGLAAQSNHTEPPGAAALSGAPPASATEAEGASAAASGERPRKARRARADGNAPAQEPAPVPPVAATPRPQILAAPARSPQIMPAPTRRADGTVTLLQPVDVQLAYGRVRINQGTLLKVLEQDATTVKVSYMNSTVVIPVHLTDLR